MTGPVTNSPSGILDCIHLARRVIECNANKAKLTANLAKMIELGFDDETIQRQMRTIYEFDEFAHVFEEGFKNCAADIIRKALETITPKSTIESPTIQTGTDVPCTTETCVS